MNNKQNKNTNPSTNKKIIITKNTNKKIIITKITKKIIITNNRDHSHTKNNSINPAHPNISLNNKTHNMSKIIKMNIKKQVNKKITKNKRKHQNINKVNIFSMIILSRKEILIYLQLINWKHNSHWPEIIKWVTNNNGKRIIKSRIINFSLY